jgi:hypothetical protein
VRARCLLVAPLVAAFLTVALAPCRERAPDVDALAAASGATSVAHEATRYELSLVAACPCGCEKLPAAGSGSVRLGVALPTSILALAVARPAPPDIDPHLRRNEPFASRIEHVPLAAETRLPG